MKKEIGVIQIFLWVLILTLNSVLDLHAQDKVKIHSHNDYMNKNPFWEAYQAGASSIEADVILQNDKLYVAHEIESIEEDRHLESLYLIPMKEAFLQNGKDNYSILIDLKTQAYPTLKKILEILDGYHEVLFSENTKTGIKLVISGNRPTPEHYTKYPDYIFFDHQNLDDLDKIPLDKVAMVSFPFYRFAGWRGIGEISEAEIERLKNTISKVHSFGKPIRFWGTPDTESAWELFHQLGIDYINTDKPQQVADFFRAKNLF